MALLRGSTQIVDATINRPKLDIDFLNGSNWDITNGANDFTITGLVAGANANDAVNYQQLLDLTNGIEKRFVARVRAQGNVAALTGTQTIDTVALVDGDTILCDQQTTTTQDGLYIVRAAAWERHPMWDTGEDVGAYFIFVKEGTDDNSGFVCSNNTGSDIVGTDDLVFNQFSGAGSLNAGAGLVQNGSDFDVVSADLSLSVAADNMQVNIGTTNGTSLEVSASGLEIPSIVTGARSFTHTNTAFDITVNDITFSDSEVGNGATTTAIPFSITPTADYGNGNAIAAGGAVDQFRADFTDDGILNALVELKALVDNPTQQVIAAVTTLNIGGQTATLTVAPATGVTRLKVYLNGNRVLLTTEYTITNAVTGEITFTAAQPIVAGDSVVIDYVDA